MRRYYWLKINPHEIVKSALKIQKVCISMREREFQCSCACWKQCNFLVHYPDCLFLQVAVDGESYHKSCFRCTHGGCVISPSNYVAHEHRLYCKHHHTQLFKQKGNFSQLGNGKNEQVTVVAVAVAENAAAE